MFGSIELLLIEVIYENKTANTSIVSYYIIEEPITDTLYYPYPTSIYVFDNLYKRSNRLHTGS